MEVLFWFYFAQQGGMAMTRHRGMLLVLVSALLLSMLLTNCAQSVTPTSSVPTGAGSGEERASAKEGGEQMDGTSYRLGRPGSTGDVE